ncbi:MAG: hypothetical protein AVDCRST_MAG49-133, partial [uncultured Thermomicrobiales bacterium]
GHPPPNGRAACRVDRIPSPPNVRCDRQSQTLSAYSRRTI